jgi:hypothetical protein
MTTAATAARLRDLHAEQERILSYLTQPHQDPPVPPLDCRERLAYCAAEIVRLEGPRPGGEPLTPLLGGQDGKGGVVT